jgi:hypothetical protein
VLVPPEPPALEVLPPTPPVADELPPAPPELALLEVPVPPALLEPPGPALDRELLELVPPCPPELLDLLPPEPPALELLGLVESLPPEPPPPPSLLDLAQAVARKNGSTAHDNLAKRGYCMNVSRL